MTNANGDWTMTAREQQDELLRDALATGLVYAAAGSVVGVSERTVRRRMSDPAFAAEVSTRRGEHVGAMAGQLVQAGIDAIAVLRDCLTATEDPVRLRAAHLVLSLGTQLRHAHELEERLTALEAQSGNPGQPEAGS